MFKRLKRALVTSFVGTIALGWVFAQVILHFAYIFSAPIAGWLMRREYRGVNGAGQHGDRVLLAGCAARIGPVLFTSASWIFLTALVVFQTVGARNNGVGFGTCVFSCSASKRIDLNLAQSVRVSPSSENYCRFGMVHNLSAVQHAFTNGYFL